MPRAAHHLRAVLCFAVRRRRRRRARPRLAWRCARVKDAVVRVARRQHVAHAQRAHGEVVVYAAATRRHGQLRSALLLPRLLSRPRRCSQASAAEAAFCAGFAGCCRGIRDGGGARRCAGRAAKGAVVPPRNDSHLHRAARAIAATVQSGGRGGPHSGSRREAAPPVWRGRPAYGVQGLVRDGDGAPRFVHLRGGNGVEAQGRGRDSVGWYGW
jgi:hypothetical protein